jgi:hypothetical protein
LNEKEINMKTYRTLSNRVAPLFLAAIVGMAGWASTASAADSMATKMVPITNLATPKSALIGAPEGVVFSGQAMVKSRRALDPDGESKLLLSIDMSGITALGSSSGAKYVLWSQDQVIRPLSASQQIEIIFPFSKTAMDSVSTVRTGVATFALVVDPATGTITSASGTAVSR